MPSTRRSTVKSLDDDNEEVSAQVMAESEAGPSRHPLRSKKPRQNLPYARNQKRPSRKRSEEEQGGFFSSVKNILSLKWLRNSPSKVDDSSVINDQEKIDSDSEKSVDMNTVDADDHTREEKGNSMGVGREPARNRKDLVINSDKGKKSATNGSEESLYPRVPSFDSSTVTPLRTAASPVAEVSQIPSSKQQSDADIIEYVRRIGRESLAKKKVDISEDLYTSKSPFRFVKQRSHASTRTPSRSFGVGINSVGRRPFSQNLSPGSPGSEQQTKRRKTVEQRNNEVADRFGTPQFPFTPSEARRIMENIESMSSPFSEAKKSTITSSSLRKSVHNKSILLEDDIAPPTKTLSLPLSLPGLPYSKERRNVSKNPSRLSEVSEFLSSVNEKKKMLSQQLEVKKSAALDTPTSNNVSSTDEASTQEATSDVEEHPPSKSGFSFGTPVTLSEVKAPPLPIEFKRTEVEKPVDDSPHMLKKYSLKMKSFSTRQHGSSNRFSARDEDLNSDGEESEALKTVAPAPLLNTSDGFSFGAQKSSVTNTTLPNVISSNPSIASNKSLLNDATKDGDKQSDAESVTTSITLPLQAPQNTESKSNALSGFSFGSVSSSKVSESKESEQSAPVSSITPDTADKSPTPTKPTNFSFGNTISTVDTAAVDKSTAKSGFSFGSPEKSEKPTGFSFGSNTSTTIQSEPSITVAKDKSVSNPLETAPSTNSGFSFSSVTTAEPKTPAFSFGTVTKPDADSAKEDGEKPESKLETTTPSFSFGASASSVPSKPTTPPEESKTTAFSSSTFTFGAPNVNEKPLESGSQPSSSSIIETHPKTTSSFTFGNKPELKSDAGTSNSTAVSEKVEPKATGFTFGVSAPSSEKPETKVTSFGFGTKESPTTNNSESKPEVSFGAKQDDTANKNESKPGFSFGSVTTPTTQEESKSIGFTFGGAATNINQTKSKSAGFTFGSSNAPDTKATGFAFGTPTSTSQGPALAVDGSTPVSSSSPFAFGTPATATSNSGQSGFTFGTSTTEAAKQPSFSFGVSSASETPKTTEESKPSFGGFGATNTNSDSKPSFTFGASTTSTSTPTFSGFGTSQPSTTSVDSKPSTFTFGSANSQPQPSGFTFGAPAPQTATFNTATQSQATPAPFTFGSSNSDDAMSSTPPAGFGGFGANTSTATTSNSSAPFTFGGSNTTQSTTPNFSFGANPASQPPSMTFGSNSASANPSSFTFGSSGSTGFGASAAQPQPQIAVFGGNTNPAFGAPQSTANQSSTFTFGSGNNQAASTPGSNFNFSATPSQPASFTFGANTPAPQANFGFGGAPAGGAQSATPGGFNMGTSTAPPGRKIARPKRRTR